MKKKPYYLWHLSYVISQPQLASLLSEAQIASLGELCLCVCEEVVNQDSVKGSWNSRIPDYFQ